MALWIQARGCQSQLTLETRLVSYLLGDSSSKIYNSLCLKEPEMRQKEDTLCLNVNFDSLTSFQVDNIF